MEDIVVSGWCESDILDKGFFTINFRVYPRIQPETRTLSRIAEDFPSANKALILHLHKSSAVCHKDSSVYLNA